MTQQLRGPKTLTKSSTADAGRKSGESRRLRAEWRRLWVLKAFEELDRPHQGQPFSDQTLDALLDRLNRKPPQIDAGEDETVVPPAFRPASDGWFALFDKLWDASGGTIPLVDPACGRDTIKKDLLALSIRSKQKARCG